MSQRSSRDANARRPVRALILAPTRELALQVSSHLSILLNPADVPHPNVKQEDTEVSDILSVPKPIKGKAKATEAVPKVQSTPKQGKRPPLVSVAAIVGGMSTQKQRRILERGVDIIVATPGRLWDILQEVRLSFDGIAVFTYCLKTG